MRVRTDGVATREVDGEIVVLDLSSSRYLKLNKAGAVLWQGLTEDASEPDLVDLLIARFGIDLALAQADVSAFLEALRSRQLLA